jgi:2'-5' RNA ligase
VNARRLFFALWPIEGEQQRLAANYRDVVAASGGRAIAAANLHITLAFLGSVPEESLPLVRSIARNVSDVVRVAPQPITLTFHGVEYWRRPRIICATTSAPSPATTVTLAEALKRELTDAGFTPDLKAFRPHVTLARKVSRAGSLCALEMTLTFRDFSLVESRTETQASSYSVIESWPLCTS